MPRVRGFIFQVILAVAVIAFFAWITQQHHRQPPADQHRLGLRLPVDARRLRHLADADSLYRRGRPTPGPSWSACSTRCSSRLIGIVLASILGFVLGIARLSRNWLVSRIATVYVETLRNIPVLLQLLFWYKAVLSVLPGPRQAIVAAIRVEPQQPRPAPAAARSQGTGFPRRWSPCSSRSPRRSPLPRGRGAARWRPASNFRYS